MSGVSTSETVSTPGEKSQKTLTPLIYLTVDVTSANLRGGPGTNYKIVGKVKKGDKLPIFGLSKDREWVQVDETGNTWIALSIVELPVDVSKIPEYKSTQASKATEIPTRPVAQSSGVYEGMLGNIWSGVKVYYGNNKTYVFEILGGSDDCPSFPSGRGVKVRYPSGSEEWKDRIYLIQSDIFFVRSDDPATKRWDWYVYNDCW